MTHLTLAKNSIHDIEYVNDFNTIADIAETYLSGDRIALSGGQTYERLFYHWVKKSIDCTSLSFYPVDERIVSFDHPQSNWGNTYRNFLKYVGRREDKKHWMTHVSEYELLLKRNFGESSPIFDVVFLGVGDDGHTASLFPGDPSLDDTTSLVIETKNQNHPFNRISLGPKILIEAKKCVTIIAGAGKGNVVNQLFAIDKKLPIVKILSQRVSSCILIMSDLLV